MKKFILTIFGSLVIVGLIWAGIFYSKNLRGIGPVIKPPPNDITKVINTTGMPLKLPLGFSISIFAEGLDKPRVMTWGPDGNMLVSIPSAGRVVALRDENSDGKADAIITVIDGLNRPHGLATRCTEKCRLYIAESNQVAVYDYDEVNLEATNKKKLVDLPDGGNHFSRTILFMPTPNEDKLLISVGSSCNVCDESDSRRAKILVYDLKTKKLETFASGLRNSVFMTIHPVTGKIWATEMGRDLIGDDIPPDEINIIEEGKNYGWPICYGKNVLDTDFHKEDHVHVRAHCTEPFEQPSYIDIPAHSAPLGLAFIPEDPPAGGWSQEYWYNLLVAYHGSWNRSVPTGYKIVRYKLDARGRYLGEEDFITGWLTEPKAKEPLPGTVINVGEAYGRPVDILVQPGGKIYISDDKAGVIYQVTYKWCLEFF